MRPIGRKQPALTTVVAAGVLVVASMLAGRGQAGEPTEPVDASLAVESGSGAAPIADRADELPSLPQLPAISVARAEVKKPKGTPKLQPSALDHPDIPVTALVAYRAAATVMERADASCGLSWTLIAAIGRVESDHGRYAGAQLLPDGTSSPAIRGVALDGTGPVARIQDTDSGRLDGDSVWDRAVGPMQFLPSTWSVMGVDADGDGVRSPDDLNDAALATAVFLCTGDGDLGTADDLRTAILRYNPSSAYVASVLAVDRSYRGGDFDSLGGLLTAEPVQLIAAARFNEPSDGGDRGRSDGNRPPRGGADRDDDRDDRGAGRDNDGDRNSEPTADPDSDPTGTPGPGPSPTPDPTDPPSPTPDPTDPPSPTPDPTDPPSPTPDPTDPPSPSPEPSPDPTDPPSPTPDPTDPPVPTPDPTDPPSPTPDPTDPPSPTPEPSPEPTPIVELAGVLAACGADQAQWCVGEQLLDVGDAAVLAAPATSDLDGDGTRESSAQELAGLSGSPVTVLTVPGTDPAVVVAINGADYAARP